MLFFIEVRAGLFRRKINLKNKQAIFWAVIAIIFVLIWMISR
jgi:hypothetical protein